VLGTHFNINSYPDENTTRTTLLEGSVKVSLLNHGIGTGAQQKNGMTLIPGQQASTTPKTIRATTVNAAEEIAWKNGFFVFREEGIESIMRKLARWYNLEVSYEEDLSGMTFLGVVSRSKNLSSVLQVMEATGNVHFKIEDSPESGQGRRIIVMK